MISLDVFDLFRQSQMICNCFSSNDLYKVDFKETDIFRKSKGIEYLNLDQLKAFDITLTSIAFKYRK